MAASSVLADRWSSVRPGGATPVLPGRACQAAIIAAVTEAGLAQAGMGVAMFDRCC